MKTGKAVLLSTLIVLPFALLGGAGLYLLSKKLSVPIDVELPQRSRPQTARVGADDEAAKADASRRVRAVLAPVWPALQASRRPVLHLSQQPMAIDDAMASKLGGRAYWTTARAYPTGGSGQPLILLAQLDLSAMRLPGYPDRGLLQFFIASDDFYGANLDAPAGDDPMLALSQQKNFRVVYWPRPDASKTVAPPAGALAAEDALPLDPSKPQRLRATRGDESIGRNDVHAAQVLGVEPDLLVDRYAEAHPALSRDALDDAVGDALQRFGSKLGGYPDFTQQDPREISDRRVLLLQIDSVDGVMWGDSGVANFFIDPDDLARGDFSKVAYHWDCY